MQRKKAKNIDLITYILVLTIGCGGESYSALDDVDSSVDTISVDSEITCGNGEIEVPEEQCDGENLGNATCVSIGYGAGQLVCGPACLFDVTNCIELPTADGMEPSGNGLQAILNGLAGEQDPDSGLEFIFDLIDALFGSGDEDNSDSASGGDLFGGGFFGSGFFGGDNDDSENGFGSFFDRGGDDNSDDSDNRRGSFFNRRRDNDSD